MTIQFLISTFVKLVFVEGMVTSIPYVDAACAPKHTHFSIMVDTGAVMFIPLPVKA